MLTQGDLALALPQGGPSLIGAQSGIGAEPGSSWHSSFLQSLKTPLQKPPSWGSVSREPSFRGLQGTRPSSEIPCGAEISGKRQVVEKGCCCGRKWVGEREERQAEKGRSGRDREGQAPGRQYSPPSCVGQAENSVTCHRQSPEYHTEGQELDGVSGGTGEPRVCSSKCDVGRAVGQRK